MTPVDNTSNWYTYVSSNILINKFNNPNLIYLLYNLFYRECVSNKIGSVFGSTSNASLKKNFSFVSFNFNNDYTNFFEVPYLCSLLVTPHIQFLFEVEKIMKSHSNMIQKYPFTKLFCNRRYYVAWFSLLKLIYHSE